MESLWETVRLSGPSSSTLGVEFEVEVEADSPRRGVLTATELVAGGFTVAAEQEVSVLELVRELVRLFAASYLDIVTRLRSQSYGP
jgi:uncharacterized NAD(P)/FAD-binding protein YdhS